MSEKRDDKDYYEIVWQVVTEELPKLKGHIRRAMGDE